MSAYDVFVCGCDESTYYLLGVELSPVAHAALARVADLSADAARGIPCAPSLTVTPTPAGPAPDGHCVECFGPFRPDTGPPARGRRGEWGHPTCLEVAW